MKAVVTLYIYSINCKANIQCIHYCKEQKICETL